MGLIMSLILYWILPSFPSIAMHPLAYNWKKQVSISDGKYVYIEIITLAGTHRFLEQMYIFK